MLIYYSGIASCGVQGAEKAQKSNKNIKSSLFTAFLSAFGGGIIRDIFILKVKPAVLSPSTLPDILISLIFAIIYLKTSKNKKIKNAINLLAVYTDALGLAQFISIGIDRALIFNSDINIAFICGIITALGGGILSSLFCGKEIHKILISNFKYNLNTIIGTFFYIFMLNIGVPYAKAQLILVIYTSISTLSSNEKIKGIIKKYYMTRNPNIKCTYPCYPFITQPELVTYIMIYGRQKTYHKYVIDSQKAFHIILNHRQRILLYHRILQKSKFS